MTLAIFCPSSHLMLSEPRCLVCGWERPTVAKSGQLAWGPVPLGDGLGGPGRHVFAQPAAVKDVAAFPLNNGTIVGLGLLDGKERWHITVQEGLITRHLVEDGRQLFATLSDERPIGEAGTGQLISLDPATGSLETLWQADTHQLSPPALTETQVLLRTSTSELIALKRNPKFEMQWKVPLNTWWALPPIVADGKVIVSDGNPMQGEGRLTALNLDTGQRAWVYAADGMLTQPSTSDEKRLIFQNGRKEIIAIDLQNGKSIWQIKTDRLYTAPVMGKKQLYIVMRGTSAKGASGYYLLKAIDPASGQTSWEASMPSRVLLPPLCFEN